MATEKVNSDPATCRLQQSERAHALSYHGNSAHLNIFRFITFYVSTVITLSTYQ